MPAVLINVDVPDLSAARDFYVSAFGLREGRRLGEGALELLGAETSIYLLQQPPGTVPAPGAGARDYQRHWTPVHLDFVVSDVEAALAQAERAGARRESELATHAWGKLVRLADPFGNGLCLVQFLGRGYDELT